VEDKEPEFSIEEMTPEELLLEPEQVIRSAKCIVESMVKNLPVELSAEQSLAMMANHTEVAGLVHGILKTMLKDKESLASKGVH
jgi:hypothetical protein